MTALQLHGYWRSSAAWRVRIALACKGLEVEHVPVHLVRDGGDQHAPAYRRLHALGLVPALTVDGRTLTQSLAIVEWLDERYPAPPLLPRDPWLRARAREIALLVACDIHPLDNLRVLQYLTGTLGVDEAAKLAWYRHWLESGLAALEAMLAGSAGTCCIGDEPSIADLCLVPQLYNARRFDVNLTPYPTLVAIDAHCATLAPFQRAVPALQPDAA